MERLDFSQVAVCDFVSIVYVQNGLTHRQDHEHVIRTVGIISLRIL